MSRTVVTISSFVLGYGSPQILQLTTSICEVMNAKAVIFQPVTPDRPVVKLESQTFSINTVPTATHPYSPTGRHEYLKKCATQINLIRPEVVVLTNYPQFELLDHLEYRPQKIVHLALEDLDPIWGGDLSLITRQAALIDVWIFPEANRAKHDAQALNIAFDRVAIFYNVTKGEKCKEEPCRNGRIVYAGTLDVDWSVGCYIFDCDMAHLPIDVYGDLQGTQASRNEMAGKIDVLKGLGERSKLRWFGQVPAAQLEEKLPAYCYSLVFWRPIRYGLLNAAPNKFFQAVRAGVPVISAPHPQTKMLIERYGCGILLDGWEKKHLLESMEKAVGMINTPAYDEMVRGCQRAAHIELSWDAQMNKLSKIFKMGKW